MSGNSAPPVPPKRNYKNRISSRSAHHPELLHASLPPQQLQSPTQQAAPASVVVGAGHNVPRILAQQQQQQQQQHGLKSSSSQQHVALPVEDEEDHHHHHQQHHHQQQQQQQHSRKAAPQPQQQQRRHKEQVEQSAPRPAPQHKARYQQEDDEDFNFHQHEDEEESEVPLHKSLKRQLSSHQSLHKGDKSQSSSQHKLRNQVEDHLVYDPNARRQSHASNHTVESNSYEDEEIEEEVLDFELAQAVADVFIGEEVEIKGDFQYNGILRLDGKFQGKLITNGDLIIGPKGVLVADIHTIQRIWLDGGHIYGQVQVEELYITGDALIKGDITCKYLHIYSGEASIMGTATVHPQAADIVPPGTFLHPNLQHGELMSRKSSQDSLAGGDYRLHSDQSGENFRSSSSNLDPKMAVEQARQAKIAAKQRRKEAKELLKRELEAKAKEQAEESERQQQAKQPKPKKEKKVSKEQPEDDSKPPMKQLTTQGSWKISTGEEAEKLANEADHNKPAVILESMEPILEDAASKDNDTDPKWNMKLTASPTKDNHSSAVAESPVRVEKTHTEVVADHVEASQDVKESAAEQPVEDKAEKETPTVDDQSALAQFSKLQEEATHVEETPAVVDAAPTEQLAEPEKVIAHEESADHTKKEEEDNAQLPEATVKQDTIQETIAPVQEATAEEESKPTEVPVVEGDKPEEAAAADNVETEGNPENKESS